MKNKLHIFISIVSMIGGPLAFAGSATWNLNQSTGNWNVAANWTPATVPNGLSDVATFAASNTTAVSISSNTHVSGIVFDVGASPFTISVPSNLYTLVISGTGITNNSGIGQNLTIERGVLQLEHNATVGDLVTITNQQSASGPGYLNFLDLTSAQNCTIINQGGTVQGGASSYTTFSGNSTAANATIVNNGAAPSGPGSITYFTDKATAGNATFTNTGYPGFGEGGSTRFILQATADHGHFTSTGGGSVLFYAGSTAADGVFINGGGTTIEIAGGSFWLTESSEGGNAIVTNYGGNGAGAWGGRTYVRNGAHAENCRIFAGGGSNGAEGGTIYFWEQANGDSARIELAGNGTLDISAHDASGVKIGSIEGDGVVLLGAIRLAIGTSNLDTTFAGVIQDGGSGGGTGGSLRKLGSGKLSLTNASTYTGGTLVSRGGLLVNNTSGSSTGTGPVMVNAGLLGGTGSMAGPVTLGTGAGPGATIAPGVPAGVGTLTVANPLTFQADSIYDCGLNSSRAIADQVVSSGVTIIGGARILTSDKGTVALSPGTTFTLINNTAATSTVGVFANLADGSTITVGGNIFQANYEGGDGNDLTLTVVP